MSDDDRDRSLIKAFEDLAFLKRDELRPVRLMLELMKPDTLQREAGIRSTIVVFGSARIVEPSEAQARLDQAMRVRSARPGDPDSERAVRVAERGVARAVYYDIAREFARIVSRACQIDERCEYVIVTGGGRHHGGRESRRPRRRREDGRTQHRAPGGAASEPFITRGSIQLPLLRDPEDALHAPAKGSSPSRRVRDHRRAVRGVDAGADGQGRAPAGHSSAGVLGKALFPHLLDEGLIAPEDLSLFRYAETADEAWAHIVDYYAAHGDV
jgi:predicted Rossmann-fold nucleotide-binding protein